MANKHKKIQCNGCGNIRFHHCRGLCRGCFGDPVIRAKFPPKNAGGICHEPTEEEVEAIVAEQYNNLPDWW